jgi:ribonuclease BN (tRNA processing enzyme)
MKVTILGTRANIDKTAPWHSKHAGVLVDEVILLDLGEKEYLQYNPDVVFITHLHPDHAFFMLNYGRLDLEIYAPEEASGKTKTKIIEGTVKHGSYEVTAFPTHHSKTAKSVAYLIRKGSSSLMYTGDIIWLDKKYRENIDKIDLIITDGSYIRKGGLVRKDPETGRLYGHNGIPDLVRLFQEYTGRIVFTHFGSWFYKDIAEARKKITSMSSKHTKVEASRDGEIFQV